MATVGFALFVAVAVTSIRAARRRLSYETWYGIHLYAYLAIALAFLHQLAVGADFVDDPLARGFWIALYVVAFGLVLTFRVGHPIVLSLRHDLRVANVVEEAPGVVSIYVTGRDLERLPVASGQYFLWRFLTGTAGGGRTRSPSPLPPTANTCASRSRRSATGRPSCRTCASAHASSSKAHTASSPAPDAASAAS